MAAAHPAQQTRRAILRLESSVRRDAAPGDDVASFLPGRAALQGAIGAGFVEWTGGRALLTAAGLELVAADHAAREAQRAARRRELEAMAAEQLRAYEQQKQERAAHLELAALAGAVARLHQELRAVRDALVERCPQTAPARPVAAPQGDTPASPAPRACAPLLAQPGRIPGGACSARWSTRCRAPRQEPLLLCVTGQRKETPAMVMARRAFEEARALAALRLAGKRWCQVESLSNRWRHVKSAPAGANLTPYFPSSRKAKRHQRPLFALGLVKHDVAPGACVSEKTRVVLTLRGADLLAASMASPPAAARLAA